MNKEKDEKGDLQRQVPHDLLGVLSNTPPSATTPFLVAHPFSSFSESELDEKGDLQHSGFLIIDKPKTWTSHDVVAKCRGILGIRKIGHLGTLDPIATGVLVLAVGREATKKTQDFIKLGKSYEVEMELGKTSNTYDADGEVIETDFDLSLLSEEKILKTMSEFWGKTIQTPPAFSAKKINGKPAYKLARAGKPVELKSKEVFMQGFDIEINLPKINFKVEVSSGTYIRSLVHDLGQKLKCGAIMTELRRLNVGHFLLENAISLDELIKDPKKATFIPVDL